MDIQILELKIREYFRQRTGLELIASENYVSRGVYRAMGSIFTNKYAEGYPGHRYYGGCENVDQVERLAIERACKLFDCEYANVQPHCGTSANMAVVKAVCNLGDTILALSLNSGGHLTHSSPVSFIGKEYNVITYNVDEGGFINYSEIERLAAEHQPKLIIAGASAYSREWDYNRLFRAKMNCNALLMFDMAHTAGLVAAKLLKNPCNMADIVTSTTHKTLRGPRGGIILMKRDFVNPKGLKDGKGRVKMMSEVLNSTVFPMLQGGPLENMVAAKAVCFKEALKPSFVKYQTQVIENSKNLAQALKDMGYNIVSGGTDNHSFLINLRSKFPGLTGKAAEVALEDCGITVNKNMVPRDNRSPFQTSGLRIGTPAITSRGMKDMNKIAKWIDRILSAYVTLDFETRREIRNEVKSYCIKYPLRRWM